LLDGKNKIRKAMIVRYIYRIITTIEKKLKQTYPHRYRRLFFAPCDSETAKASADLNDKGFLT